MLAFLGHEFIMIPLIRLYSRFGTVIGFSLCFVSSILVVVFLTRKRVVVFFSPLFDLNELCNRFNLNLHIT